MLRLATAAMGTRFELVIEDPAEQRLRPAGEAALEVIESCHRRLSRFDPASLVSHIQRSTGRPVRLDGDTFALFRDAQLVHNESDGAFDITVGSTMERLGFHPVSDDDAATSVPVEFERLHEFDRHPSVEAGFIPRPADRIAAGPSMAAIVLDGAMRTVRVTDARARIDLGGLAKGHALDLAARVLREAGVTNALLHGGTSSIIALGAPAGQPGWRVAVGTTGRTMCLRDQAMAVSAAAGRTRERNSVVIGHIIDPRAGTALPPDGTVTVVGPSARLCDAWATALAVLRRRPDSVGETYTTFFDQAA